MKQIQKLVMNRDGFGKIGDIHDKVNELVGQTNINTKDLEEVKKLLHKRTEEEKS